MIQGGGIPQMAHLEHFVDLQLGQKACSACLPSFISSGSNHHPHLPPPHSSSVRQSIYKPTNNSKQPTRPDLCCVLWWRLTAPQAPVSRDVSISAVRRAWCCCRPLFSNPLLQFSQGKLHLFLICRLIPPPMPLPCLAFPALLCSALPHCSFIYALARTRYAPEEKKKQVLHADSRAALTCSVFTSGTWILQVRGSSGGHIPRVRARQQRRPLVHAVGGHVVKAERNVGGRGSWLAAPSLRSARRSNQRLVVDAELLRSSSPSDGSLEEEELRGVPRPSLTWLRAWAVHTWSWILITGLCDGISGGKNIFHWL